MLRFVAERVYLQVITGLLSCCEPQKYRLFPGQPILEIDLRALSGYNTARCGHFTTDYLNR
jgi:hypothetical protein